MSDPTGDALKHSVDDVPQAPWCFAAYPLHYPATKAERCCNDCPHQERCMARTKLDDWRRRYIQHFIDKGFSESDATADYEAGTPHELEDDPVSAADDAMSYYDDDEGESNGE